MVGWLWFAIGRSHVSGRLSRPRASKRIMREEGGEVILIKNNEGTCI